MKARIGIMPESLIRARLLAIASGKYQPAADEPRIWYTSLNAVSQVLSPKNIELLRIMDLEKPETMKELAVLSGRKPSNLSNTLKSLCDKGFARLEAGKGREKKPVAVFTDFEIVTSAEIERKIKRAEIDMNAA